METSSKTDPLDNQEVNEAAYSFQKSVALAKAHIGSPAMSKKGLARVLKAVIEFPLGDREPKFTDKLENELFILTLNALRAKHTMMTAVIENQENTAKLLADAEKAMATTEGEANGQ